MNTGLIGLYALFLIFVGYRGNASTLFQYVGEDAKGFSEWVVTILILRALYSVDTLKPFVKPFAGLAVLTFVLKNYTTVASQVDAITGTNFVGTSQFVNRTAENQYGGIGNAAGSILDNLFKGTSQ